MRWKLLVIVSLAAAILACGIWSVMVIGAFGSARELARHTWLLFASALVPLGLAAYSGVFVYRHTSRRRKTQAAFAVILSLCLSAGTYFAAALVVPDKLVIRGADEAAPAR
jgi:cytochrome bd-type quinol oxidase subunit 2